jgi:hypothetical protein
MNFGFGKGKKDKFLAARVNTSFVQEEQYSLAVVITILKQKSLEIWGMDEAAEILTSIASLRECILEQNDLPVNTANLVPAEANRERSDAVFRLGQTITTFNLLCEKHGFKSPLIGLKGHQVLTELYKLAKLDKAFYGSRDAFVVTEELMMKKQYSDPSDSKDGFQSTATQYKFANIKLYDTIILLRLLAASKDDFAQQIDSLLTQLEDAVAKRAALDEKKEQCIEFISKNKDVEKNLRILKATTAEIEDLGRKLGTLETNLDTIARSKNIPNTFNPNMNTKDVWETLANMFEVLNQPDMLPRRNDAVHAYKEVAPAQKEEVATEE